MNATAQCKNCGADIAGRYCAACGQHTDVSIPSLRKLLVEALGDLYNFDSRLWRSLKLLLFKPGRLTREYLEGRRARYVPPFRLYVVLSLTFFFLLAVLPDFSADEPPAIIRGAAEPETPPPAAQGDVAAPVSDADATAPRVFVGARPGVGFNIESTGPGTSGWRCDLGDAEDLDPELRARLEQSCEKIAADDSSFGRALLDNVPVMMFFFIPIVAAGTKLLYPLARRKYVEHLVFFFHFHSFFFLLATVGLFVIYLGGLTPALDTPVALLGAAGWIYMPIYLFLAMRHVYAQGRLATTFKFVLLSGGYFFALLFTFVGIVVYTAFTL